MSDPGPDPAPETGLGPEAVAAIVRHMNDDHAADSLLICRTLGGHPDATAATTTGVDGGGIEFRVEGPDGVAVVRLPWSRPLTERAEVRAEVVRLHQAAEAHPGRVP